MTGILIAFEGIDSVGKATQSKMLYDYLVSEKRMIPDKDIALVSFPRYGHPSATLVEYYLSGKLPKLNTNEVTLLYAIDKRISFMEETWGEVYRNGGVVISDRYVLSDIIYTYARMRDALPDNAPWLTPSTIDRLGRGNLPTGGEETLLLHHYKFELPFPQTYIVLCMDDKNNTNLLVNRTDGDGIENDINEQNENLLKYCRDALYMYRHNEFDASKSGLFTQCRNAYEYGHLFVDCSIDGVLRNREDIHTEIRNFIEEMGVL